MHHDATPGFVNAQAEGARQVVILSRLVDPPQSLTFTDTKLVADDSRALLRGISPTIWDIQGVDRQVLLPDRARAMALSIPAEVNHTIREAAQ